MAEVSKISGVLSSIEEAIESASGALNDLNNQALKGGIGFDTLINSVEKSVSVVKNLTTSIGELGSSLTLGLDFGLISGSFSKLGDLFELIIGNGARLAGIFNSVGKGIDSVTGFSRELNATLFDSVTKFNGSFESAKRFSDYIINSAQDYASAEFGFITPADRIAAVKGLEQAGIPLEHMTDTINSAAGSMDLLNTSFLHSKSIGLSTESYLDLLGNAMTKQGLSSQKSAEQMSMFGEVSSETGIRVTDVARSLEGVSSKFTKLGVTANFGKPILQSFATSLNTMGLGFMNAIELSESLSTSLAKLTSDYSAAYITFQRGGLDIGSGGGALGASIGLRSELLKSQKGETDQGQIAAKLADAVKKTISSFTGGQIITVQQAAEDPALQKTFYTQTELLKGLYGIADTADQDRTLELLQQLGEATTKGDADLQAELGKQLQEAMTGQSKTLSFEEKTAASTAGTYAELQLMNKLLIESLRISGDSLSGVFSEFQKTAMDSPEAQQILKDLNARAPEEMKFDFEGVLNKLQSSTGDGLNKLAEKIGNIDEIGMSVATALSGTTLNVSNPNGDNAINGLKVSIDSLVQKLSEYLTRRQGSNLFGP
jgi:hypothetical protein